MNFKVLSLFFLLSILVSIQNACDCSSTCSAGMKSVCISNLCFCVCTDGACANQSKTCKNYYCSQMPDGTCQYTLPPGSNCKSNVTRCENGSCSLSSKPSFCPQPVCSLVNGECGWTCNSSSGVIVVCTADQCRSQLGNPTYDGAVCQVSLNSGSSGNSGSSSNTGSISDIVRCTWTYPNRVTCSAPSGQKCANGNTPNCNPTADGKSCFCTCIDSSCVTDSNCLSGNCESGNVGICSKNANGTCVWRCRNPICSDPCYPNCQPICSTLPPCLNSRCSLPGGSDITSYAQAAQYCKWTNDGSCYSANPCAGMCKTDAPCSLSRCTTNSNGTCGWDSSLCNIDCSSISKRDCLNFDGSGCPNNGTCRTTLTGCTWVCPVDVCQNSDGSSLCSGDPPAKPTYISCNSWKTRCLPSGSGQCQYSWYCDVVNMGGSTGTFADSYCANITKPNNDDCPKNATFKCIRTRLSNGNVSPYYWYSYCPQKIFDIDVEENANCSSSSCGISQFDNSNGCGGDGTSVSMCMRVGKYCVSASVCKPTVVLPPCVTNNCKSSCYDPRWLTNPETAPDGFQSANDSCPIFTCKSYCRQSFRICGRKNGDGICQFYHTNDENDDDVSNKCNKLCNGSSTPPPKPICYGNDPCKCDYTNCKFVSYQIQNLKVGQCVDSSKDTDSLKGFSDATVYISTSAPPICQVTSDNDTSTSNYDHIVKRIALFSCEDIQAGISSALSDGANDTVKRFVTKYFPQVNAITIPAVSTSVKIGVVLTLSDNPSVDDQKTLCALIHLVLKSNININAYFEDCTTVNVGTSTSKRGLLGTSSVSVLVGTTISDNSTTSTPSGSPSSPSGSPSGSPSSPISSPVAHPAPQGSPGPYKSPSTGSSTFAVVIGTIGLVVLSLLL